MRRILVLLFPLLLVLTACSDDTTEQPGCVEGSTQACVCTDGSMGAQTCNASGAFDACVCAPNNTATDAGNNMETDTGNNGFVNPCGGQTELENLPGSACGPCEDGFWVCDGFEATRCLAATELNACDSCGPLPGAPGEDCGCGDDVWTCQTDGTLTCLSAPPNSCGGCVPLADEFRDDCDGGAGFLSCSSENELICVPLDANACGGNGQLAGVPGAACGECMLGKWECNGPESVVCNDSNVERNACGGCGQLDARRGDSCGACGGEVVCDGSEATRCDAQVNPCGGCGPLSALPGSSCPGGVNVCDGSGGIRCSATASNPCGGTVQLADTPGDSCGTCGNGVVVCVAQNAVSCVGDTPTNSCGGCDALPLKEGDSCGPEQVVVCDPANNNQVLCTDESDVNACGGTTPLMNQLGTPCGEPADCREIECDGRNATRCGPADADPTDRFNCGACGRDCPEGQICSSGNCMNIPAATGKWIDIEVGNAHGCALTDAGDVWCWGDNSKDQLAATGVSTSEVPIQVMGISGVADIAVSDDFSCAVLGTGEVVCWGTTTVADLFGGVSTNSESPTLISGVNSDIVEIDAGWETICARSGNDTLQCWGSNSDGKLGIGSAAPSAAPGANVPIPPGTISSFSVGGRHACATSNQTAFCWGRDVDGELGDLNVGGSNTPVLVNLPPTTVVQVAAGFAHTCAVSGVELNCWGNANNNAIGRTTSGATHAPGVVTAINSPAVIELGHQASFVARSPGIGGYYPFGTNNAFRLGNGRTSSTSFQPVLEFLSGVAVVDISVDETWGCALDDGGNVYCWGTPPGGIQVLLDGQIAPSEPRPLVYQSPYVQILGEVCNDGLDNDSDGPIDCESSSCIAADVGSVTGDLLGSSGPPAFDSGDGNEHVPASYCQDMYGPSGIDKVIRWTAPSTGNFRISGSSFQLASEDYVFYVLDSCDRNTQTMLACSSYGSSMGGPSVPVDPDVFAATMNTDYYIVVSMTAGEFAPLSMMSGMSYDNYSITIDPVP